VWADGSGWFTSKATEICGRIVTVESH
jgi:hypothetical protein